MIPLGRRRIRRRARGESVFDAARVGEVIVLASEQRDGHVAAGHPLDRHPEVVKRLLGERATISLAMPFVRGAPWTTHRPVSHPEPFSHQYQLGCMNRSNWATIARPLHGFVYVSEVTQKPILKERVL